MPPLRKKCSGKEAGVFLREQKLRFCPVEEQQVLYREEEAAHLNRGGGAAEGRQNTAFRLLF